METLNTPKNKTDKTDKQFTNKVKKAAAILVAALGLTVAGQQSANAQELDFSFETEGDKAKKEVTKLDEQNAKKRNTIIGIEEQNAEKKNKNAEILKEEKEVDARLKKLETEKKAYTSSKKISGTVNNRPKWQSVASVARNNLWRR